MEILVESRIKNMKKQQEIFFKALLMRIQTERDAQVRKRQMDNQKYID